MTTLEEKVKDIFEEVEADYNSLPFKERKRIGRYMQYMQILTIWQCLHTDQRLLTPAWVRKKMNWLESLVAIYQAKHRQEETDG